MIKINLSAAQKQVDISNLGGFDFTKLKIKAIGLVILVIYLPDFVILPIWEEDFTKRSQEFEVLQRESGSLKRKVSQSST